MNNLKITEIMNNENNDTFFLFKIVIIECSNVWKTQIQKSYVIEDYVFENNTKKTVGISSVSIKIKIDCMEFLNLGYCRRRKIRINN